MAIYTKRGDAGETLFPGGSMVKKNSKIICALGAIDEGMAFIEMAGALLEEESLFELRKRGDIKAQLKKDIGDIVHILGQCCGEISGPEFDIEHALNGDGVFQLEKRIDELSALVPKMDRFIFLGSNKASAMFNIARTVVRRAEREVVSLSAEKKVNLEILKYLNRLSDYLFCAARAVNYLTDLNERQI
jgi:cob(I)alamin adenosyltransferase